MSKAAIGERGLSFVILRFGVLRFCRSPGRRHRKKIIFKPAEEEPFQTGVGIPAAACLATPATGARGTPETWPIFAIDSRTPQ
jgi:hypothetical protein